jgi:hypothetical protein
VESDRFLERFGRLEDRLGHRLEVARGKAKPLGDVVDAAFTSSGVTQKEIALRDLGGTLRRVRAEAFFNQYSMFVFFAERRIVRLGKRIRVKAS